MRKRVWGPIRSSRTYAVAALAALAPFDGARAQEAPVEFPAIEVVTSAPKQKKYPASKVAKKPSGAAQPATAPAPAQPADAAAGGPAIPDIVVVGDIIGDRDGLLKLDGAGHALSGEELYTSHVFTTNEALRKVPGVYVRDEEGFGMRPNIGIRGLNPTRSTKTLLLEDGLFLTFAPYGDNASYFHPTMDRFERVEVIKGADQILYGPQTISGAVNYVTPNPPRTPSGFAAATVGNRDYFNGQLYYGGWYGPFGGQIDYVHKQGDGARDNVEHDIEDFGAKGIVQISPDQALIAKLSYFNEDSDVTYTGLTEAEAKNFGIRYNPFDNDRFDTERLAASLTHNWDILPELSIASSVYWTSFDRDWWRSSSNSTDNFCNNLPAGFPNNGTAIRNARLAGQPIDNLVDDTCATGRVRSYETYGFQQRATLETALADGINNQLQFGYRLHSETQDRKAYTVPSPFARENDPLIITNENLDRDVNAWSVYAHNRVEFGPFSVTPMVRYEDIEYKQFNNLNGAQGEKAVTEVIPGISVGFAPTREIAFFAGIHEGFAPPTVADSISGAGATTEVDSEHSTNIEVGFKSEAVRGMIVDATYFHNDFDNLIATGSVAGNVPLAQGEALFEGSELYARLNSDRLVGTPYNVYGQLAWTWLWTAEQTSGFVRVDNGAPVNGVDTTGNRQPYAPEHLITAKIGYAYKSFDVNLEMVYVGDMYADFLNLESGADHPNGAGSNEALSGQFGKIASHTIFNLGATYTIESTETDLNVGVKNLFDQGYIVDRTRGILPGAPRLLHVGVKQSF